MYFREVKKKINLLGNPSVGKTSLILRYVKNIFGEKYLKTIGTNVYSKDVEVVGANVKLMIQDVMGEKSYETVHASSFNGSSGAIFVVDATDINTFNDIFDYWIPKYVGVVGNSTTKVLAINKMDLDNIVVTKECIVKEVSRDFDHIFFTSAKTGENVENTFNEIASRVLFKTKRPSNNVERIIQEQKIENPQDLLGALFTVASITEELKYSDLEELFEGSGIDRLKLENHPDKNRVIDFAKRLRERCKDLGDTHSVRAIDEILRDFK